MARPTQRSGTCWASAPIAAVAAFAWLSEHGPKERPEVLSAALHLAELMAEAPRPYPEPTVAGRSAAVTAEVLADIDMGLADEGSFRREEVDQAARLLGSSRRGSTRD